MWMANAALIIVTGHGQHKFSSLFSGLDNTLRHHITHDDFRSPPPPRSLTLAPSPGVGPLAGHHGLLALSCIWSDLEHTATPLQQGVAVQQQGLPVLAAGGGHAGRDTAVQVVQPDRRGGG